MCKRSKFGLGLILLLVAGSAPASDLAILRNGFTIRHERREVLGTVTRLYPSASRDSYIDIPTDQIDHFEKDLWSPPAARAGTRPEMLHEVITEASGRHHLDPDLVSSVIRAESGFNPRAVSAKGAQGLMQLMPQTASQLGVADTFDPNANVEGGARYLRELLERYNFDLIKALAAYNAGPQRVEQYRGLPTYYETRVYVSRVIRDFNRKKLAEKKAATTNARKKKAAPRMMQAASQ
ncbi:MAG TPA: lytic transglycosylase domain-containing protein [Terriglobales bacterium]|jgi:hypothetical protein|nr:lytic transglycosylase domain-containing protein [Terriglobales bacterium]